MIALLSWACQSVFLIVVAYFALYVLLEFRVFFISRRVERRKLPELGYSTADPETDIWPAVSVLLPIHNESAVVERLIDAACLLRYPAGLLEILVLDDSTDDTTELARAKSESYVRQGIDIRVIRRRDRKGYKAGNLVNGIKQSRGEFFAIFDADFVPSVDFLLKCIPFFKDQKLGFLQTGIGYENRDVSFLTRFQAMEMGHQQYVTVGLSEDGDMASLSGSSCVWRKVCVDALGGWNASTVTEDVDLGYRAQFGEWKYAYLRDVVSMSVLPETISAFRIQRERWGRGLIHSGFKHVRQMLLQRMPLMKRMHALSVMFSSVLLASIYVLILLSLPITGLVRFDGAYMRWGALAFFGLVVLWGLENAFGARRGARFDTKPNILKDLWDTYRYVALFLPMAWYYFVGGVRALFGVYGDFHRTPKGGDASRALVPPINRVLLAGEVFTFLYSAVAIGIGVEKGNYFLIPLNVTVCVGFGMALYWSWLEMRKHSGTRSE
jgi:cellulose synthase (UDP-forming)